MELIYPENAVSHSLNYGPAFGGGHDLFVSSLSKTKRYSYMKFSSYEFPNGKSGSEGGKFIVGGYDHKFQADEIEVFQSFFKMDSKIMLDAEQISFQTLTGLGNKSFSLLWRGSRDGFDAKTFHQLCFRKKNTVTVIKNTNCYIFGGFTSIAWSSSQGYKTDSTAFLFSLTNPSNTPLKMKVTSPENAVYHRSINGPTFGRGCDLHVSNLSKTKRYSYMNLHSYEFPNGKSGEEAGELIVGGSDHKFQADEIEVFQVL